MSDEDFEDARSNNIVTNVIAENVNIANESLSSANENTFARQGNRRSGARNNNGLMNSNMNYPSSGGSTS